MTNAERRAARAEVDAARAALVTHLNELEYAVNVPKRFAENVGSWARDARRWAAKQPVKAATVAAVGIGVIAGAVALAARLGRR